MFKMTEIRKMDKKTLEAKVLSFKKELFMLKMQHATSGVEKPHKIQDLKKDIARFLTAMTQKGE